MTELTKLEEAQVRVARAQEQKDVLAAEITKKHGALRDLDIACQHQNDPQGKHSELRREYNRAVRELRLAKSDLERERNEQQQQKENRSRPAPCPGCERKGTAHCESCSASNGYRNFKGEMSVEAAKDAAVGDPSPPRQAVLGGKTDASGPWWKGGPLDTVSGMPWLIAVVKLPEGQHIVLDPGKYDLGGGVEVTTRSSHRIARSMALGQVIAFLKEAESRSESIPGPAPDAPAPVSVDLPVAAPDPPATERASAPAAEGTLGERTFEGVVGPCDEEHGSWHLRDGDKVVLDYDMLEPFEGERVLVIVRRLPLTFKCPGCGREHAIKVVDGRVVT